MKTRTRMLAIAALILAGAALVRQADAALIPNVSLSYSLTYPPSSDPTCSTDLVNNAQSTLSSVSSSGNVTYYGGSLSKANDGAFGTEGEMCLNPVEGATVTFTLNTNSLPAGYDILQITSYAGYIDGRRAYQNYDVAVHTVGSASGTFAAVVSTGARGYYTGAPAWTTLNVGDGGYLIATGVDQIQLTFHPCRPDGAGEQPGGYWSDDYCEIDVFGNAPYVLQPGSNTPPPATNITPTWTYSNSDPGADTISNTDLVNRAQSSLHPSVIFSGSLNYGTSPGALNDGSWGLPWNSSSAGVTEFAPVNGAVVTYSLNIPANGLGRRLGYDIKQIVSFASYSDGRRSKQCYDVAAHYVGTAAGTFVALSSVVNLGHNNVSAEWTQVNIGNGSSVIASGVDQLQFTFYNNNNPDRVESIYREIDVFGSLTPPPSGTVVYVK